MKIIINVGGVKREIHGSFSICGSRKDFVTLQSFLSEGTCEGFNYGWIDIYPEIIVSRANESPYDWWQEGR